MTDLSVFKSEQEGDAGLAGRKKYNIVNQVCLHPKCIDFVTV